MAYQLLFRSPVGERVARLDGPVVVGRDAACDVVIDSVRVSRRHAEFVPSAGGVTVRDLGSRNGVIVNGTRVEQANVGPADRVLLGDVSVVVQAASADAAGAPPPSQPAWPAPGPPAPVPDPVLSPPPSTMPPPSHGSPLGGMPAPVAAAPNPFGAPAHASPFGSVPDAAPASSPFAPSATPWPAAGAPAIPDKTTILPAGGVAPASGAASRGKAGRKKARSKAPAKSGGQVSLMERLGLGGRVTMLVVLAALVATFVGTIPLVVSRNNLASRSASLRVATVARALALEVGPALASGQTTALGIGSAMAEPGVREALVLTPQGRVLAPPERLDETIGELPNFGPVVSLQGTQTASVGREAEAVVVIDAAGRRVGVVWVRLDPSYESTASGPGLFIIAALFTALVVGVAIGFVVRKMIWGRLQALATDIDLASSGQLATVSEPFGVPRLAESINFVVGRLRSAPPSSVAPNLAGSIAPAARDVPAPALREGALVLNAAYVIQEVRGIAAALLESAPDRLTGRHVIEAVTDQALVGAILDGVSELASQDTATRQVDAAGTRPALELQARKTSDGLVHVSLRARG